MSERQDPYVLAYEVFIKYLGKPDARRVDEKLTEEQWKFLEEIRGIISLAWKFGMNANEKKYITKRS